MFRKWNGTTWSSYSSSRSSSKGLSSSSLSTSCSLCSCSSNTTNSSSSSSSNSSRYKSWSPDTFWSRILSKSSASAGELSSYEWPPSARHGDQQSQHEPSHWQVLTHSLVWSLHHNPILSESLLCLRCLSGHIVTGQATGTNAFYHHTTSIRQGFPLT